MCINVFWSRVTCVRRVTSSYSHVPAFTKFFTTVWVRVSKWRAIKISSMLECLVVKSNWNVSFPMVTKLIMLILKNGWKEVWWYIGHERWGFRLEQYKPLDENSSRSGWRQGDGRKDAEVSYHKEMPEVWDGRNFLLSMLPRDAFMLSNPGDYSWE